MGTQDIQIGYSSPMWGKNYKPWKNPVVKKWDIVSALSKTKYTTYLLEGTYMGASCMENATHLAAKRQHIAAPNL